jgi:UDPglucose--hexose-1-phosphate uridylyltransferase
MSKYVPDILSRRWVIIAEARTARPEDDFSSKKQHSCVFCPGNEKITGEEVMRLGEGDKDQPGWKVRVIPNKFPITDYHEVIIHTPKCNTDLTQLPHTQIVLILQAYKNRYQFYQKKGQVLIFCNHGEHAGASIIHSHSQLVVIPNQINMDALTQEPLNNMVEESKHFHVYCPDFSQWPYEVWITPKKTGRVFGDIEEEEMDNLATILQRLLKRLEELHTKHKLSGLDFGYNYYIYPKENWYLRIIPRFVHRAGFELGTGLNVNIVDPADAAGELQDEKKKTHYLLKRLKHATGKSK